MRYDADATVCSTDVDSKYLIEHNNHKSWEDAKLACESNNNENGTWGLAVINSEEEFQYLNNITVAGEYGKQVWIGLTDKEQEGMEGTPVNNSKINW